MKMFFKNHVIFYIFIHFLLVFNIGFCASVFDYIPFGNTLFGNNENERKAEIEALQKVPYEVAVVDEKFIEEAAKLTGVALSGLDKCQHRVILQLQNDCHNLNDEEISKLAVQLLNCQSHIEGRPVYPCTESMPIRECTSNMDPDTWNSYLLMSNRARAVCYSIRQSQFRGLTELTVNKLMGAAHEQLDIMSRIKEGQSRLEQATSETLTSVVKGNDILKRQQDDLRQAQFHGQLVLEDNIRRLADEKQLILEGHEKLTVMTQDVKAKLEEAAKQIESQAEERKDGHMEILNDLVLIQQQAEAIFMRIEQASKHMLEQSALAAKQYESTLKQLAEVNSTVHSLVQVMSSTRSTLEEKLNWLAEALGGTDNAVERLYLFITHATYLLLAMISCAFLQVPVLGRLALMIVVPLNLFLALQQGTKEAFGFIALTLTLISAIGIQLIVMGITKLMQKRGNKKIEAIANGSASPKVVNGSPQMRTTQNLNGTILNETVSSSFEYKYKNGYSAREKEFIDEVDDAFDENLISSPTPPLSRYEHSRSRSNTPSNFLSPGKHKCAALTRQGKQCTITAQPGREFCFKHQTGSSVIVH